MCKVLPFKKQERAWSIQETETTMKGNNKNSDKQAPSNCIIFLQLIPNNFYHLHIILMRNKPTDLNKQTNKYGNFSPLVWVSQSLLFRSKAPFLSLVLLISVQASRVLFLTFCGLLTSPYLSSCLLYKYFSWDSVYFKAKDLTLTSSRMRKKMKEATNTLLGNIFME